MQKFANPLTEASSAGSGAKSPTGRKKKKKKKQVAKRPEVRPPPTAEHHHAATLVQARCRGNMDRIENDFYRNKETVEQQAQANVKWLQRRCEEQKALIMKKKLHHFDYWKKYDGNDKLQPCMPLSDIGTPWCMVFALLEHAETGEFSRLSYECVEICQRCWAADLHLDASIASNKREIVIKLGAPYEILSREAEEMELLMRMKETKGAMPFQVEYMTHYTPNRFSPELAELGFASPFTSGHRQRLIQNRMTRLAGIDLIERMQMPVKEECMENVKSQLAHKDMIRAQDLKNLMTTYGCFRPHVEQTLGLRVRQMTDALVADKYFVVYPPEKELSATQQLVHDTQVAHFEKSGLAPVTTDFIRDIVSILSEYATTEQAKVEIFHGTLRQFFPTHNHGELAYFKERWGKLSLVCQPYVRGKAPESEHSETYHLEDSETKHYAAFYVPLDAIRDYFGDDVGLYTAWLRMYTKGLVYPAFTGFLLFILGIMYFETIDDNWLSIPYSVYMSLWSVLLLNFWVRRENELQFLWGTEELEVSELPRPNFQGVLKVNKETERETMVHPSQGVRAVRLGIGVLFCVTLVFATGFSAFLASLLKFRFNPESVCRFAPYLPAQSNNTESGTSGLMWESCTTNGKVYCEEFNKRSDFRAGEESYGCDENQQTNYAYGCMPTPGELENFFNMIDDSSCPIGMCASSALGVDMSSFQVSLSNLTSNLTETTDESRAGFIFETAKDEFGCYQLDRLLDESGGHGTAEWFFEWAPGTSQWDMRKWGFLSSFCNLIIIQVAGQIFEVMAVTMNEWENHRTQTEYEDMLILKNFMFQFINNYFVLFYIAYLRQIEILGSSQVCGNGSCLSTLQQQLGVVFTVKTFGLQAVELFKPMIMRYIKGLQLAKRRQKLMDNAGNLVVGISSSVLPANVADFVGVDEDDVAARNAQQEQRRQRDLAQEEFKKNASHAVDSSGNIKTMHHDEAPDHVVEAAREAGISVKEHIERSNAEAESFLDPYDSTFDDFNEMVIQYGYVALFAPAYSLAPLLALINNIIEIRVDAVKLCFATQRPHWKAQADIGSWYTVLNILGFAAVITNSTMIAFVGYKLVPQLYVSGDKGMLMQGGITERITSTELWMYAVAIEHGVMLTRVLIQVGFADQPEWLTDARELLEFRFERMKTAKEIEEDALEAAAYQERMDGSNAVIGFEQHKSKAQSSDSVEVKFANPMRDEM
eukprot:SAG22_NODE_24_length_30194_cov_6.086327_1_plen_1216_part_00